MKTKLICLSPRLLTEDNIEKQFVNTRYTTPLINRGFNTLMLTLNNPNIDDLLNVCDGFLVTGGTDIDPSYYNEENDGLSLNVDKRLDEVDKAMINHAVENKKPLLGICRGHQALNVFLGGSLHQDLDSLNEVHKRIQEDHFVNTTSHKMFNWDKIINVNSYHHQAIKDLADNLEVVATHNDGTIEMVVHKSLPIFAVQWHPEIYSNSEPSVIIFDAFAKLFK